MSLSPLSEKSSPFATGFRRGEICVLYGAGNLGMSMVETLRAAGFLPIGFLDRQKGGECASLPISTPESAPKEWKKLPVLITVFNPDYHSGLKRISEDLAACGFARIIPFEAFYQDHPGLFGENKFWLTDPAFYRGHEAEIEEVFGLFYDEKSRDLYRALIRHRLGGSWENIPDARPVSDQYFDPEVCRQKHFRCFVDIGAFTGDTLETAINHGVQFDQVIAFEPDMNNLHQLCRFLNSRREKLPGAIVIPAGVGSDNTFLSFFGGVGSSSNFSENGNSKIPVVALDEVSQGLPIDFIKMDIEGAEMDALSGMEGIIRANRPMLAVSVYHRPEDIFRIPLHIKKHFADYRFLLRLYGEHCLDTVLYALPA